MTTIAIGLLGSRQRRKALRDPIEADGHVPLDRLVDLLVAGTFPSTDGETARVHVAPAPHHAGRPMLRAAGVVESGPRRERVQYRSTDPVEEVFRAC